MRLLSVLFVLLCLGGCGSSPSAGVSESPVVKARVTVNAALTVPLRRGWNAVGLQGAQVTAVSPSDSVAGLAFFDGVGYGTRAVSVASLNEGAGTRRGLWVFAASDTSLTYNADGPVSSLDLVSGWNLVAFPSPVVNLVRPETVLPQFTEIQADNSYRTVETVQPGRAYWIYALSNARLSWSQPVPSPQPRPSVEPSPSPLNTGGGGGGGGGGGLPVPAPSPSPTPIPGFFQGFLAPPYPNNSPHQFACADFNADGQPDLAEAAQNRVAVFLQSRGGLNESGRVSLGLTSAQRLLTTNLNSDQASDLVAWQDGNLRLLRNDGTGNFTRSDLTFTACDDLAATDLNRDGVTDLVGVSSGQVTVALGTGASFTVSTFPTTVGGSSALGVGDLDRDGNPDLLLGDANSTDLLRYLGRGDGTFGAPATFTRSDKCAGLVVADLNADGKVDVASQDENAVTVFLGDGAGGFAPYTSLAGGALAGTITFIQTGDFNGDGRADLVGADGGGSDNYRFYAGTAAGFAPPVSRNVPTGIGQMSVGDLNRDGCTDLFFGSTIQAQIVMGRAGVGPAFPGPVALASPTALVCADFDNDKRAEVVAGRAGGEVVRYFGSSTGALGSSLQVAALGSAVQTVSAGDLNADGALDLVVGLANGQIYALRGLGTGAFAPPLLALTAQSVPRSAVLRDLNGDGKLDLALAGTAQVEILRGDGAGGFSPSFGLYGATSSPYGLVSADFNRDGAPDLATLNSAASQVVTLLGPIFGQSLTKSVSNLLGLQAGDFDGDGLPDLTATVTGTSPRFIPLWGDGQGGFATGTTVTGYTTDQAVVGATGSLNGDALSDLVLGSSSYLGAFLNQGSRLFSSAAYYLSNQKVAVAVADVTGDGVNDLVWASDEGLGVLPGI